MKLTKSIGEIIEKIIGEEDNNLADLEQLTAEEVTVLFDLERKLYAMRRCIVKRYSLKSSWIAVPKPADNPHREGKREKK